MFVGPVVAYILTKRICLGLQRKDAHLLEHGVETGIIRQLPSGEFIEETRPVSEEKRATLVFRSKAPGLPSSGEEDENGVPAPQMRGALGKVRARLYNIVTESAELEPSHGNGHGDGHGNGHGEDHSPAAVTSGETAGAGSGEDDQHGS
jgi:ubiquinol-cytochrome c reductase cytochrome b subunit